MIAHVLVYGLARLLLRLKVIGAQNVPAKGGVIIAANHLSYMDIPLIGCSLSRRADFVGKSELFSRRWVNFFFRRLGGFPIRRSGVDRLAIDEAVRRLKAGRAVVFYPEGRRSEDGRLSRAKPGIGMVAAKARVPIVPALIEGTDKVLPKGSWRIRLHPVTIKFGPPLNPPSSMRSNGNHGGKAYYENISQAVMDGIYRLKEESVLS